MLERLPPEACGGVAVVIWRAAARRVPKSVNGLTDPEIPAGATTRFPEF